MAHHIFDILTSEIKIDITPNLLNKLNQMVLLFEIRDAHPMTLNSQLFGVHRFIFIKSDFKLFFETIGYDEIDIIHVIKKIPSININFKVTSDALNLMIVYLVHLILNSHLNEKLRNATIINLLNYMQYRLFSSAINHYFRYGVSDDIMQSVIESLNLKFSIRQYESWKSVITERSKSLIFDEKAHHSTLSTFNNDKDIVYLISDTSTRIRSQMKVIVSEYYDMKKTNTFITSHTSTTSLDGEKIIRETAGGFSIVGSHVYDKLLIKQSFIDEKLIKMVQSSVSRLNESMIRRMLSTISDEARSQADRGEGLKTITLKGEEIYFGIESLVEHIVHIVYSTSIENKNVNINSKIAIYNHVRNIFTAARTSNKELINVRNSFTHLCNRTKISNRESTISGLGIVFALYLTLVSFGSF